MIVGHAVENSWNEGAILSSSSTMVFIEFMDGKKLSWRW